MKEEGLPLVCEEEQGSLAEEELELEGEEEMVILSYLKGEVGGFFFYRLKVSISPKLRNVL